MAKQNGQVYLIEKKDLINTHQRKQRKKTGECFQKIKRYLTLQRCN